MPSQIEISVNEAIDRVRGKVTSLAGTTIADYAKQVIAEKAEEIVYSYGAEPIFMASRMKYDGGLQDPDNMFSTVESFGNSVKLTIESIVPLQNLFYPEGAEKDGSNAAEIVESGAANYHQPEPREYHEAAEKELATNGKIASLIKEAIER